MRIPQAARGLRRTGTPPGPSEIGESGPAAARPAEAKWPGKSVCTSSSKQTMYVGCQNMNLTPTELQYMVYAASRRSPDLRRLQANPIWWGRGGVSTGGAGGTACTTRT